MKQKQLLWIVYFLTSSFVATNILQGCNTKKKEENPKTEQANVSTTEKAIKAPDDDPIASLPVFEEKWEVLEKYYGNGRKNPKKFVIRFEVGDISNPSSLNSKLLLYPTETHKDYGKNQEPLEIPAIAEQVNLNSNIIIGNNEFDGNKNLLTTPGNGNTFKKFDVIRFTPTLVTGTDKRNNHLAYKIELITAQKANVDLGNTKPSPPAPPEY